MLPRPPPPTRVSLDQRACPPGRRRATAHATPPAATAPPLWACPVCSAPLHLHPTTGRIIACIANHTYDIGRERYVTLARHGRKKRAQGTEVGDGAASYSARGTVFAAGVFDPVFAAAAEAVAAAAAGLETPTILDAGCGDGSYAGAVAGVCPAAAVLCVDVTRNAVATASKRVRAATARQHRTPYPRAAVASSFDLPLPDACVDVALIAFAPFAVGELARVLRATGAAVVVRPGPSHLDGLKALIYGDAATPRAPPPPLGAIVVTRRLTLSPDVGGALLGMTPYAWRGTRTDAAAAVIEREGLTTTIDVVVETVEAESVGSWRGERESV